AAEPRTAAAPQGSSAGFPHAVGALPLMPHEWPGATIRAMDHRKRSGDMKRFIGIGLATAVALALVASVATAANSRSAVKVTSLVASYKGRATTQQSDTR